jgi:hypothetical protein
LSGVTIERVDAPGEQIGRRRTPAVLLVQFKSYDQGRLAFQSTSKHVI